MTASDPSKDSVLMLQADQIVSIEVEKLGSPFVGTLIFLSQLQSDSLRILVGRIRIVDWNCEKPCIAIFVCYCCAQISRERSDATLSRQVVADECDTGRQG